MFESLRYQQMYQRFNKLYQVVTLMINNGTGFTTYEGIKAHVARYTEDDLVSGSSVKVGDIKVIIPSQNIPDSISMMREKDRIEIDGRSYAVVLWDDYTRKMGEDLVAVQVAVRG